MHQLKLVDSITELGPHDMGCIAISGSHGGISSAQYALAARPMLSIFNDAGVGKDQAGLTALDFLQGHSLAACTVSHNSACIGHAKSTLHDGVVNHCNLLARELGIDAGHTCQWVVDQLQKS
jgi:hypothetical protein